MAVGIDTPAKRARLAPRKNPYWLAVAGGRGGVSLGYRKAARGSGAWVAKTIVGGRRAEERVGLADDSPPTPGAMDYGRAVAAALEWSGRQRAVLEARVATSLPNAAPTVRAAVDDYVARRTKLSASGGTNADGRLAKHVLSDEKFASTKLARLSATGIEEWRDRLEQSGGTTNEGEGIAPATINRLLNDLRAALNAAAIKYRRELPAHIPQEIRIGTKKVEAVANARRQILADDQIVSLVNAAFEVDDTGDFGRLTTLLAATGARHSQAAAVKVGDFQHNQRRVLMPGSKKGRSRRVKPPAAIQLSAEVCARLMPAVEGRDASEPLLERWHHVKKGRSTWERAERRAWRAAHEVDRYWPDTVKKAGLPADTIMYALRHSSIVRGLRAMLPVALVASLHDTSIEMIEDHYAAFIVDATEELARRAIISL